jgi:hypothetical protein
MKRHIYIKDFKLESLDYRERLESAEKYSEYLSMAYNDLIKKNTRIDNKTGKIRDNSGVIEEYVNPSDHEPYKDYKDVKYWFVAHYVICRASRFYNLDRM